MQDGCRILGSGKYGKMAKKYQHHKLPSCLGYPKHEGKDEENLTHFFGHYQSICKYMFDDTVLQMLFYMIVFFSFIPFGEFLEKKGQDVCKRFHSNK